MKTVYLLLLSFPVFFCAAERMSSLRKDSIISSGTNYTMTVYPNDTGHRKENPVIPGDFADPSVIRNGKIFYATGTSSEWAPHFPLFQSTDLLLWTPIGYAFSKTPSWAAASFWAPELFYRNGTYFLYYVARKKADGISCIGVATSKDPAKGFIDQGILVEFGKEAIDPFVIEQDGELYMTWKAYGLDQRPIEILGSRLSDDGLKLQGEAFTMLRDDKKKGLEGQCLIKKGQYYYLFYSTGACCGRQCSYQVEVARAESIQGPFIPFAGNPILSETKEWKCAGHGTFVTSVEGKDYYMYHAYSKLDDVYTGRQGMLGEVNWDESTGWPGIEQLGGKVKLEKNFRDDFLKDQLSTSWQWDFRHAKPHYKIKSGSLYLSGEIDSTNNTGTALTVRPLTGDYEISTEVINQNSALKGLVLYGDAGQSVGIGVASGVVTLWNVKNNKKKVLKEAKIKGKKFLNFKILVSNGYQCRFFWNEGGSDWQEIGTGDSYYNGDFLPQWDRSPRPGLLHHGPVHEPGVFSFFEIIYR